MKIKDIHKLNYLQVCSTCPKVDERKEPIQQTHKKWIHEMHQACGKRYHKTIKDHADRIKGMRPEIVKPNGTIGHG